MVHLASKKGSTLVIILALIGVFSILGVSLLMSNSQTDKERKFIINQQQLYYVAEAGLTHAFHKLKTHTPSDLWFEEEGKISAKLDSGSYDVTLVLVDKNSVEIKSTATLGKSKITRTATAKFLEDRRITLNTPFLCQEEISRQWVLNF
ncbi:MAG: pilus assembly PilX N-terminal domain-containing protein [Candidatus Muiribacteriota bacterium]|jgi:Tfp pilus assembly protein PilX